MESKRWIAGRARASSTLDLELAARPLRYGDAVFATLAAEDGCLLEARAHLARLMSACRQLGLTVPDPVASVTALVDVLEAIGAPAGGDFTVRIQVSAAGSRRGYDRATEAESWELIEVSPPAERRTCRAAIAPRGLDLPAPALPDIKSCSALPHVLAARQAARLGVHELIRLVDGRVTEAVAANVFWLDGGVLRTPGTSLPIYPGVTRETVIDVATRAGLRVDAGEYDRDSVAATGALFFTNATRGIEPVAELDGVERDWPAELSALSAAVASERARRGVRL